MKPIRTMGTAALTAGLLAPAALASTPRIAAMRGANTLSWSQPEVSALELVVETVPGRPETQILPHALYPRLCRAGRRRERIPLQEMLTSGSHRIVIRVLGAGRAFAGPQRSR